MFSSLPANVDPEVDVERLNAAGVSVSTVVMVSDGSSFLTSSFTKNILRGKPTILETHFSSKAFRGSSIGLPPGG